jgi:RNA polymerase sigma factor (sigma-70 family)
MGAAANLTGVIRTIRTRTGDGRADADLLAAYAGRGDQAAFAAVVQRYGGLVLGVARRQLADSHQAEDVFQATFLALARSAPRLGRRTPLANWLYTVALRQARKLRARTGRRAERDRTIPRRPEATDADPLAEVTGRELLRAIDDEVARLPDRYRLPVLLCCLQGLSREEAAAHLGWTDGTVKGRLERGRQRLAERLAARGLAPAVAALGPLAAVVTPPDLLARAAPLAAARWSRAHPPGVLSLAAARTPRRLLMVVAVAGSVVAVGLAGWAAASGGKEPAQPARPAPPAPVAAAPVADAGDPLPPGSLLRFGTSRFRQGTAIRGLAVSADGKLAVAASGSHVHGGVRGFNLADGRVRYNLGPEFSAMGGTDVEVIALSPDDRTLAAKGSNTIYLFDARTGKEVRKVALADTGGGTLTEWITFTPDGKAVALTQGHARGVVLVDLETGTVARTFPHANVVYAAAFSPDGKRMAAGGYDSDKGTYFTRLWEVATGTELRRLPHGNGGLRTVTFSPDGKWVAGGGDGGWARVWEADTGKEVRTLPKAGYRVRSVAFAPDGKTLAVAGDTIRLFDPATGGERLKIDRKAIGLRFSADGKVLTGAASGTIHQWAADTGKLLTPAAAGESAVDQVLVSPDGRRLVTRGQDGDAHVWDARTGAHLRAINAAWQRGLGMSPDGRYLVWPVADETVKYKDPARPNQTHTGTRLRLYDPAADALVDRFGGSEGDPQELSFTADGRDLVTVDHRDGAVRVTDVATGKERRAFRVVREGERAHDYFVWGAVLAPDGKTLAVTYQPAGLGIFSPFAVRLWDVGTGAERHELGGHYYYATMAFSPDSRLVVTCSQPLSDFAREQLKKPANQVFVWDVRTGKRLATLPDGLPTGAVAAAFGPDGRTLVLATPEGKLQVWETATWTVRAGYRGHRDRVNSLAFGPDGRLFSGGLDTTVLAWDLRPPAADGPLDAAWATLADADGGKAYRAQGHLLAVPAEAVKLISGRVKPAATPEPKVLAGLITDLDSPDFATRERASKRLAEIGRPALVVLREAARTAKSSEVEKRAADLIERIDWPAVGPDELRAVRAVEVLSWAETAEAAEALSRLARGEPSARVTAAAEAALRRLTSTRATK